MDKEKEEAIEIEFADAWKDGREGMGMDLEDWALTLSKDLHEAKVSPMIIEKVVNVLGRIDGFFDHIQENYVPEVQLDAHKTEFRNHMHSDGKTVIPA